MDTLSNGAIYSYSPKKELSSWDDENLPNSIKSMVTLTNNPTQLVRIQLR